ncbi:hypothetical protein F5148DRAFT_1148445 [Russula earlei]|uniref:Uncharacterized protein n=1 Tax=Russula earlei TaxID=71964 RepID=A0ACC0UC39_9AGAM|nr:hypothetical protein F5148DRAFT_1148445 [Russula earlei]
MSSKLPTGLYTITNVAQAQSPGHDLTRPTMKPIVGTDDTPVWSVEHVDGDRYRLTLYGFVTRPNDGLVWSYLGPETTGAEWILAPTTEASDTYNIILLLLPDSRLWTLKEKNAQVSLGLREGPESGPNQRWIFHPMVLKQSEAVRSASDEKHESRF